MDDHNMIELLKRLERMEESLAKIQACLLGEFGGQPGLIPEHRQCQIDFARWKQDLEELRAKVFALENYKREIIAYGAGVMAVVVAAWEIARAVWIK